jgi:predicted short-subunit dehydrogenase-like oxidoreductase (DUF2520 family)
MTIKTRKIVLVGAGKVASQLSLALFRKGYEIMGVYNRTASKGLRLAKRLNAGYEPEIGRLTQMADLYIVAVSDSAIPEITGQLRVKDKLVAHTSGMLGMEILSQSSSNTGVFYPVQTFSGRSRVNFSKVPVCIEGNTENSARQLTEVARTITEIIHFPDHRQRQILHLSAVFASNFTNYMYSVAEEILLGHDLDFNLLKPLIQQTARNTRHNRIFQYQTGPAVRGDHPVIAQHRALLKDRPDLLEMYNVLTSNIIKQKILNGKL